MTAAKKSRRTQNEHKVLPDSITEFSTLVARFYDAPLQQDPSWDGALAALRHFFAANFAVSIFRPPAPKGRTPYSYSNYAHMTYSSDKIIPDVVRHYNENFYAIDLFVNLPLNKAYTVQDFMDEEEWMKNEFYRKFLAPMDVFHLLAVDICTSDNGGCQIRICRPKGAPPFSQMDREYLELLVVHMTRCVELHGTQCETNTANKLFSSVFDRLMFGSIIIDQYGFVLKVNSIAEDILQRKDGLSITGGKLHAMMEGDNKALQAMISHALETSSHDMPNLVEALSVSRMDGEYPLGVLVRNVSSDTWVEGDRRATVAVLCRDPLAPMETSRDAMRRLFGFTPAEAGLAMILADGKTLDDAAQELNVSMNTVRTHLKSIFLKTSTTRQTDLVRMLLGSVATIC